MWITKWCKKIFGMNSLSNLQPVIQNVYACMLNEKGKIKENTNTDKCFDHGNSCMK